MILLILTSKTYRFKNVLQVVTACISKIQILYSQDNWYLIVKLLVEFSELIVADSLLQNFGTKTCHVNYFTKKHIYYCVIWWATWYRPFPCYLSGRRRHHSCSQTRWTLISLSSNRSSVRVKTRSERCVKRCKSIRPGKSMTYILYCAPLCTLLQSYEFHAQRQQPCYISGEVEK